MVLKLDKVILRVDNEFSWVHPQTTDVVELCSHQVYILLYYFIYTCNTLKETIKED